MIRVVIGRKYRGISINNCKFIKKGSVLILHPMIFEIKRLIMVHVHDLVLITTYIYLQ